MPHGAEAGARAGAGVLDALAIDRVEALLHGLAQPLHADPGHLAEQGLAVGEVAVRRVVRDPGAPRHLAQDQALGPLRAGQLDALLEQGGPEVAVVVGGGHDVIVGEC